ncbi:phospholipase [Vibrio azureus]|uniref:Phospholipase A1 n=1 Tax=Vibrio azureus NBRC 104587 TaxID=1219077 RepID=U3ANN0_9VIBR|nr:phospholipase [Vibrio azureus]GAD75385.1 putative phospholipase A [Vibrio azureus NBRC 104587]
MLTLKGLAYTSILGLMLSGHAMANYGRFSAHHDNYLLPAYWESDVNQNRFKPLNPNGHAAKDLFVQFQLSMKYKLLSSGPHGLFVAYTQRSNWEAYDDSAYFRDNQYNPEIFYRWDNLRWQWSFGFEHQSNGAGGQVEVSWNRLYMDVQWQLRSGFIRFKPWIDVGDNKYNPDIVDFLGHGEIQLGWRPDSNSIIKLTAGNILTKDWQNGFYRMSWDFPVYQGLRGYMKVETGYGLTISNYNFDETAAGIGFAFDF